MNNDKKSVGRPQYSPKFPNKDKWTFHDLCVENDVVMDPESEYYGKGPACSLLTLRKMINRDKAKRSHSLIVKLKDEMAPPSSQTGMGRKSFLYMLRTNIQPIIEVTENIPDVSVDISLDQLKAISFDEPAFVDTTSPTINS